MVISVLLLVVAMAVVVSMSIWGGTASLEEEYDTDADKLPGPWGDGSA